MTIRTRRQERESQSRRNAALLRTAEDRGCLVCRRSDGGFKTQEHVFPESIGNKELVLPRGIVCDRCNNEALALLDQGICDFPAVKMRRTMLGIRSKAGQIPEFRFTQGSMKHRPGEDGADPTLIFEHPTENGSLRETSRTPDGKVTLEWKASGGRRMTPRYASVLSRGVLKSALECAWLDHGKKMLEPRFDHIRSAVLGEPRVGYFAMAKSANPDDTSVSLTYHLVLGADGLWRMPVVVSYFGVMVLTDSRLPEPPPETLPFGLEVLTF